MSGLQYVRKGRSGSNSETSGCTPLWIRIVCCCGLLHALDSSRFQRAGEFTVPSGKGYDKEISIHSQCSPINRPFSVSGRYFSRARRNTNNIDYQLHWATASNSRPKFILSDRCYTDTRSEACRLKWQICLTVISV